MKIIQAMRDAEARARENEERENCAQVERGEKRRERERPTVGRCGRGEEGSVRQGRPVGIALCWREQDTDRTCQEGARKTEGARERTRRTKSLTGVSTWAR